MSYFGGGFYGRGYYGGGYWGGELAVSVQTNTPGRIRHFGMPGQVRGVENEAEKLARRINEGTIQVPVAPQDQASYYAKESLKLTAALAKATADAEASRQAIARLEERARLRQTEKAQRELLIAQQALALAQVREAVLREEMEVLDIAFLAAVTISAAMQ